MKTARVNTRKREAKKGISLISLSEVYPIPDRHKVSAVSWGDGLCVVMPFGSADWRSSSQCQIFCCVI
jgi:hypothetical protein